MPLRTSSIGRSDLQQRLQTTGDAIIASVRRHRWLRFCRSRCCLLRGGETVTFTLNGDGNTDLDLIVSNTFRVYDPRGHSHRRTPTRCASTGHIRALSGVLIALCRALSATRRNLEFFLTGRHN
jgi:hypothetical protein